MDDKTFTQEEVNAIVQKRLAEEKAKFDKQLEDVRKDVSLKEKQLTAKEELQKRGLSPELASLVKFDDDTTFKESLDLLESTYKKHIAEEKHDTLPIQHYKPAGGEVVKTDPIRDAMGL